MRRIKLFLWATVFMAGCGGDDDGTPLTCEVLSGPNCWATAVMAVNSCTMDQTLGTFNEDKTSCDYDDGSSISFNPPFDGSTFDLSTDQDPVFSGTLNDTSGNECARVQSDVGSVTITVNNETTSFLQTGLVCPDGTRYTIGFDVLQCLGDGIVPGYVSSGLGTSFSFGLLGGGDGANVFSCAE